MSCQIVYVLFVAITHLQETHAHSLAPNAITRVHIILYIHAHMPTNSTQLCLPTIMQIKNQRMNA